MRIVGALLFLVGAAGTAVATARSFDRKRPADIGYAVLAPALLVVALAGALLVFVPEFFS